MTGAVELAGARALPRRAAYRDRRNERDRGSRHAVRRGITFSSYHDAAWTAFCVQGIDRKGEPIVAAFVPGGWFGQEVRSSGRGKGRIRFSGDHRCARAWRAAPVAQVVDIVQLPAFWRARPNSLRRSRAPADSDHIRKPHSRRRASCATSSRNAPKRGTTKCFFVTAAAFSPTTI